MLLQWLYDVLQAIISKQLQKKELWTKFHILRSSVETQQRKTYLEEVGIQSKAVFIQMITSELFEQLISDIYIPKSVQDKTLKHRLLLKKRMSLGTWQGSYFIVRKLQKKLGKIIPLSLKRVSQMVM